MKTNQLMKVATEVGLPHQKALLLLNEFKQFFEEIGKWEIEAFEIVVTDETQIDLIDEASMARKKVQRIRLNLEDSRVEQKRNALMEGKAIDGMANVIKAIIKPIEDHLYAQEHFVKIRDDKIEMERREKAVRLLEEKERKERLAGERKAEQERRDNIKMRKKIKALDKKLEKQETVINKQTTEIKETEWFANKQMEEVDDLKKERGAESEKWLKVNKKCPSCGYWFKIGDNS